MPKINKAPRISNIPRGFTKDQAQQLVDKSKDRNSKRVNTCSRSGCFRALQKVILDPTTGCYVPVCSHAACSNPAMPRESKKKAPKKEAK